MNIINSIESGLPKENIKDTNGDRLAPSRISEEMAFWQNGAIKETDNQAYPRLQKYWDNINYGNWSPSGSAWSAAFVSYIMRHSLFPGKSAHYAYTQSIADGNIPGWQAYSIPKNQRQFKLSPGDILVAPRGSGNPDSKQYWKAHGDVVWQITGGQAILVGGNLSHTVKIGGRIPVDDRGYPIGNIPDYLIILKKNEWIGLPVPTGPQRKWFLLALLGVAIIWSTK